jgi:hypothetical protein
LRKPLPRPDHEAMTRRELWLLPFVAPLVARIGHELTIPDPRTFAKAIGLPKGWAIQKLENIYSQKTGRVSLRWVSLYEIDDPSNCVFAMLPEWEETGRFAVRKILP